MPATSNQKEYIEILVDHIGFKDSPLKEKYIDLIHDEYRSFNRTSYLIDKLLEERRMRFIGVHVRKKASQFTRISDIADFAFCPASYSIKSTHILPPTRKMEAGESEHETRCLEKYLQKIKKEREAKVRKIKRLIISTDDIYGDMLTSTIIHRGHDLESSDTFFNREKKISGNPDYIFIRKNNEKFIVEEKHTWFQSELTHSWFNNTIQVLGYINLFDVPFTNGYVVYFQHLMNKETVKVFRIDNDKEDKEKLSKLINELNGFRNKKNIAFDPENINLRKCLGCSVSPWCSHKSGKFETVTIPYYHYYN